MKLAGIDFGQMVGPLPLGAWLVVVGGGLGIAYYGGLFTQEKEEAEEEEMEDISGVPGVGVGGFTYLPPETAPDTTPQTNTEWGVKAIAWLIARGQNAATATNAITKALAGGIGDNALTVEEYALWTQAVQALGPPPDPVAVMPPSPGTPAPKPQGTTKVTGVRVVDIDRGRKGKRKGDVKVVWNAVPGATRYEVRLNPPGEQRKRYFFASTNRTSFSADAGKNSFRVRSFNALGLSGPVSDLVTFTMPKPSK